MLIKQFNNIFTKGSECLFFFNHKQATVVNAKIQAFVFLVDKEDGSFQK